VQQDVVPQIPWSSERMGTFHQTRCAHRDDGLREQLVHLEIRVGAAAQANRRVESCAVEIHYLQAGRDPYVDLRVGGIEPLQARYQPLRGERRGHAQLQRTPRVVGLESLDGFGEPVEALTERR
jgi:hypothetical protein